MADDDLNGWKQIATHLGKAVRTAQRWEQELGLPVHRIHGPGGEIIYARASELDEWKRTAARTKAGRSALQTLDNAVAGPPPATPPGRSRTAWLAWTLGSLAVLAALGLAAGWELARRQPAASPKASGYTGRESLNAGPWPIAGHDMHRTNQSLLSGPTEGRAPRLLYDPGPPPDDASRFLVTIGPRTIVLGSCGSVVAVDLEGRKVWQTALVQQSVDEAPVGFAMGLGFLVVTTDGCTYTANRWERPVYWLTPSGQVTGTQWQEPMSLGAGIGPHGTVFTISENNRVTAYSGEADGTAWRTDLPGYSHSELALDSSGNLYVGTDGGYYHQASLWSLTPDGNVRWSAGTGSLSTPVVTPEDRIVVANDDSLCSYRSDGKLMWSAPIGSTRGLALPLALGRSGVIYARTSWGVSAIGPDGINRWTVPSDGGEASWPGPILDKDENLYVGFDNQVCSISPAGRTRWCVPLDDPGAMIIAADGLLCVMSHRNALYTIGAERPGASR